MPAELFDFPPRRDGDVPPDVVAILRRLAKLSAEAGADPQASVAADLELLLVCDHIVALMRQLDEATAVWQRTPCQDHHPKLEEMRRKKRALRPVLHRAMKCRASTPAGLFAKAVAVKRVGAGAAGLAVSLAQDLLNSPELRAAIWPPAEPK